MNRRIDRWVKCPLKQEIRALLWESYIKKLTDGNLLNSYLTLYTQELMDVKYLWEKGLIKFDDEVYRGVVGVAYDTSGYAETVSQGQGRLDLLMPGDIRQILTQKGSNKNKMLTSRFPFDAINLDFCNSIFVVNNTELISLHLKALENLFEMQNQKNCQKFCLFLTTRAESGQFAPSFISELEQLIDLNIHISPHFGAAFHKAYNINVAADLLAWNYNDFATIGLMKLVVSMLSDYDYEAVDSDAIWLIRDTGGPYEGLLHLAFLVEKHVEVAPAPVVSVRQYGRKKLYYHARHLLTYLNIRSTSGLKSLKQSSDLTALQDKHAEEIGRLSSNTFQLKIPKQLS